MSPDPCAAVPAPSQSPSAPINSTVPAPFADADTIDVSVIVPIYNLADYLAECLDSLVAQENPPRVEVIIVNDGSSDTSAVIAQRYCTRFPGQFRLINSPHNQGVAVSRNLGVAVVRGTYFTFVDGDDLLPAGALRALFDAAEQYQVDIVKGNNTIFNNTRSRPANYNVKSLRFLFGADILTRFFEHRVMRGHTWGKLLRTNRFAKIQHQPGVRMAQDALFFAEALGQSSSLALIPDCVYHYRLREGSSTNKKYDTQAYQWWLYSVDNSGRFARTPEQRRAYASWQLRTYLQIANEAGDLSRAKISEILSELKPRLAAANFTSAVKVLRLTHSLKWLWHFLKLQRILRALEHKSAA